MSKNYFAHATAVIDEGCTIGVGTKIWHFCHIMTGAKIGKECKLGQNVFVANDVAIGDRVKIQNNVSLYGGVEIADDVFLGPSCVFTNVKTPRAHVDRSELYARTIIGKGATIGANATIVCGIEVGEYAFVGAGAVLTKSVPPHALMLGVPAQQKGWVCHCGVVLPSVQAGEKTVCSECARSYREVRPGELHILQEE
jgi:UDP-2-acetamido-3-amino-2,3-dideoxy-glucuronate N-acetyltransferase